MKKLIIYFLVAAFSPMGLAAQCNGGHSTSSTDAWLSCAGEINPNPDRSEEHWILYEFDVLYTLEDSHLWNYNTSGSTDNGVKDIAIDVSTNGVDWVEWGLFAANEAPGTDDYFGETGPDFDGIAATHVLISVVDNWGGDCFGFAEIKMNVSDASVNINDPSASAISFGMYPNPTAETLTLQLENPNESIIRMLSLQGAIVKTFSPQGATTTINVGDVPVGVYLIQILQDNGLSAVKRVAIIQ